MTTRALRRKAATFPGIAKGTPCTESSFKAGRGTFLFLGHGSKGLGFKALGDGALHGSCFPDRLAPAAFRQ